MIESVTYSNKLIAFIGFPKTGSRWLLSSLWSQQNSGFDLIADYNTIARDFILNNPLDFDPDKLRNRYESKHRIFEQRRSIPVIHHEGFFARLFNAAPPNTIPLEQLAATFPESRVILVVREQCSLLMSWYRHNVRLGLGVSLEDYLQEITPGVTPYFRFDLFQFHKIVAFLYKLYGKKNVLVLPYELLKTDRYRFLDILYTFSGAKRDAFLPSESKVNVGLSMSETKMLARLNRWFVTDYPLPRPGNWLHYQAKKVVRFLSNVTPKSVDVGIKIRAEKIVKDRFKGWYRDSNRELQSQIGFDLQQYGYDV